MWAHRSPRGEKKKKEECVQGIGDTAANHNSWEDIKQTNKKETLKSRVKFLRANLKNNNNKKGGKNGRLCGITYVVDEQQIRCAP